MTRSVLLAAGFTFLVFLWSGCSTAPKNVPVKSDSQIIREFIQKENNGEHAITYTAEAIFVSSSFPRPIVGEHDFELARPKMEEVARSRPNERRQSDLRRLVVAESGDYAYEFGDFTIRYDLPDKTRAGFNGSYLRVWRKIGPDWKVDAFFSRTDQP